MIWMWVLLLAVASLAWVPFAGGGTPRLRFWTGVIGDAAVFVLGTLLVYFFALGREDTGSIANSTLFIVIGAGVSLVVAVALAAAQRRATSHQRRGD